MRTIKTNLYTFDELSNEAKQKAFDELRTNDWQLYHWQSENIASLKEFAKWIGADGQGDYSLSNSGGDRGEYVRITNVFLWDISGQELIDWIEEKRDFIKKFDCSFTGYCMDHEFISPFVNLLKWLDDTPESIKETLIRVAPHSLSDLVSAACNHFLQAVNTDAAWAYSDEGLKDFLEANEYEFLESGELHG